MPGTLPFYGKGAATKPQDVAGYDYIPYSPNAAGRPQTPLRRMTQSLVRHARPKNIQDRAKRTSLTVKKASRGLGRRLSTMLHLPCDSTSKGDGDVPPMPDTFFPGVKQQRDHPSPGQEFNTQGSALHHAQGIPHAIREQWLLDNPERTTKLDAAVTVLDRVEKSPSPRGNNLQSLAPSVVPTTNNVMPPELARTSTVTNVTSPINPMVLPAHTNVPAPAQSWFRAGKVPPVNPAQTFESILEQKAPGDRPSGLHRAIGLNMNPAAHASKPTSSTENGHGKQRPQTLKRKPVPNILPYHPDPEINAHRAAAARAFAATPVSIASIETPDFGFISLQDAAAAEEQERKQTNRQSYRRGEMDFDRKPEHPFHLPSGAVIGGTREREKSSMGLSVREAKQLNRISYGFLNSGPSLSEAVEEIFEQALESPPNMDSTPLHCPPLNSTPLHSNPQDDFPLGSSPRTTRTFVIERGHEQNKAIQATPDETASTFRPNQYPLLNFAAQTLTRTGSILLGPISQGHTNHKGSPPTLEVPSVGEFTWRRWSDQDYVDPAVEDSRKYREKRRKQRKQDRAAWNTRSAGKVIPENVTTSQLSEAGPSDKLTGLISSSEPPTEADRGQSSTTAPTNKRHSAFLRSIDFTDSTCRSSPPEHPNHPLGDLIQF